MREFLRLVGWDNTTTAGLAKIVIGLLTIVVPPTFIRTPLELFLETSDRLLLDREVSLGSLVSTFLVAA
jgi:hypothetical protein